MVPAVAGERLGERADLARPIGADIDGRVEASTGDGGGERTGLVAVGVQMLGIGEGVDTPPVQQCHPMAAIHGRTDEVPPHETGATHHQKVHTAAVNVTKRKCATTFGGCCDVRDSWWS